MNIHDAMLFIATQYGLNADALPQYADRDPHTGWDRGAGRFPMGSLWRVEGQTLYALVYATQPRRVVELGTHFGAGATHIAQALADLGSEHDGHLTCVDLLVGAGSMIPDDLRRFVTVEAGDAIAWLDAQPDNSIDFLFEDLDHRAETVQAIAELAQRKIKPGGWMVAHDALHWDVGANVQKGLHDAGMVDTLKLLIEPSDCGLAIWRKPVKEPLEIRGNLLIYEFTGEAPAPEAKPKKSRSKKAAE